jgi:hypothetical protein
VPRVDTTAARMRIPRNDIRVIFPYSLERSN